MSKKIISFVSFLLIFSVFFSFNVNADYPALTNKNSLNISIGNYKCYQDEKVTVPIVINNNKGIWSIKFKISYNKNLFELISVKKGDVLNNTSTIISTKKTSPISFYMENQKISNVTKSGTLMYLEFKSRKNATLGKSNLLFSGTYDRDNFINSNGNNVSCQFKSGSITVLKSKYIMSNPKIKKIILTNKTTARITYGKVTNANKYEIYRSTNKGKFMKVATTKKTNYIDKKLTSGNNYKYKIKAINKKKKTKFSSAKTIAILNYNTKIKVSASMSNANTIKLKVLKRPAGAIGFQVIYANNTQYIGARKVTTKSNTIYLKNVLSGYNYSIKIRAYNIVNGKKVYTKWTV